MVKRMNHNGLVCFGYRIDEITFRCKFASRKIVDILEDELTIFSSININPKW